MKGLLDETGRAGYSSRSRWAASRGGEGNRTCEAYEGGRWTEHGHWGAWCMTHIDGRSVWCGAVRLMAMAVAMAAWCTRRLRSLWCGLFFLSFYLFSGLGVRFDQLIYIYCRLNLSSVAVPQGDGWRRVLVCYTTLSTRKQPICDGCMG